MKSGLKLLIGIVVAVIVIGIVVTLFQSVFGYVLLFLAAVGLIAVARQLILGNRVRNSLDVRKSIKGHIEKRAHRELKDLEKRIRR